MDVFKAMRRDGDYKNKAFSESYIVLLPFAMYCVKKSTLDWKDDSVGKVLVT